MVFTKCYLKLQGAVNSMEWKCKLCSVSLNTRAKLFGHYQVCHSHYSRVSPLPCLYNDCIFTFQSFNAMRAHLSRCHNDSSRRDTTKRSQHFCVYFTCVLCDKLPFCEATLFTQLRSHLKSNELVACPFKNCNYRTNVYSLFNAHKSRKNLGYSDFDDRVLTADNDCALISTNVDCVDEGLDQCQSSDQCDLSEMESRCETNSLRTQLNHYLASLFLKMHTILHVSDIAKQEIVDHLTQIYTLSQPIVKQTIK